MKKFYFYGVVQYQPKDDQSVPTGNVGLHCVEGEDEELMRKHWEDHHNKINLYYVNSAGESIKFKFNWYGECKEAFKK